MTEWDDDDAPAGRANMMFVLLMCAVFWPFYQTLRLLRGFCQRLRPRHDSGDQGADWGREGAFHSHHEDGI